MRRRTSIGLTTSRRMKHHSTVRPERNALPPGYTVFLLRDGRTGAPVVSLRHGLRQNSQSWCGAEGRLRELPGRDMISLFGQQRVFSGKILVHGGAWIPPQSRDESVCDRTRATGPAPRSAIGGLKQISRKFTTSRPPCVGCANRGIRTIPNRIAATAPRRVDISSPYWARPTIPSLKAAVRITMSPAGAIRS